MADKKQMSLAVILTAFIAMFFWTQSRFPALDQKAQMGQRTNMSAIAFDIVLPVNPEQAYLERVAKSAVNWGYTNWKGMTFGLIFAAAFITFLRLLPTFGDSRFRILNALKGMVIGVPLGVCANCSTPIAHGMVRAGTRLETALATLMSSPTLNVFVLTMTFSLLPFHIAISKVLGVMIVVLFGIPLVLKMLSKTLELNDQLSIPEKPIKGIQLNSDNCEIPSSSWLDAISRVTSKFLKNLVLVIRETLPLMILAGVLGAIAIETIPFQTLSTLETSLIALLTISIIGAFLPVPIAFDIIIVVTLLTTGFSVGLGASLLFSLGIFSIYPAMVIARQISLKLSAALFSLIVFTSTAVGATAQYIDNSIIAATKQELGVQFKQQEKTDPSLKHIKNECQQLTSVESIEECISSVRWILDNPNLNGVQVNPEDCNALEGMSRYECMAKVTENFAVQTGDISKCDVIPIEPIKVNCKHRIIANKVTAIVQFESLEENLPPVKSIQTSPKGDMHTIKNKPVPWSSLYTENGIEILEKPFLKTFKRGHGFTKVAAESIGISITSDFRLTDFFEPFKYGRGTASGDLNNDGLPDLVFGRAHGPAIFLNQGNGIFSAIHIKFKPDTQLDTFLVSFVDINNDGWQDLYFSTYGGLSYIVPNSRGKLIPEQIREISTAPASVSLAAGFYDQHGDGDLDMLLGNWTAGAENQFSTTYSSNTWVTTEQGKFTQEPDRSTPGETLSVLFSDFTMDSMMDLVVANDNLGPDMYYVGTAASGFSLVSPNDIIPSTSLTTMSVDSADFNNDLKLDLFTTDMSFGVGEVNNYCSAIQSETESEKCSKQLSDWVGIKSLKTQRCQSAENKRECLNASLLQLAKTTKDPSLCTKFGDNQKAISVLCKRISTRTSLENLNLEDYIPQEHANKLLINTGKAFVDSTKALAVDNSYWSWNSKAADLDGDGWQDILVANGFGFGDQQNEIHSNIFFLNNKGKGFTRSAKRFGLHQLLNTPSYTYVDLDVDGDLDIVSSAIMAAPQVHLNDNGNNRVSFELRDYQKNRFCVGCKIIIETTDRQRQLREIKLSGGFMSFDNPAAYFGLNKSNTITSIKVVWSDGEVFEFQKPLPANKRYRIERMKD